MNCFRRADNDEVVWRSTTCHKLLAAQFHWRDIMNVIKLSQVTQCRDFCTLIKLYLITMETPHHTAITRQGEISFWAYLKKVKVPTDATSMLEDILREVISLPKISTPVPPYSHWTWKTGIEVYLFEISQNSLKGYVLSSSCRSHIGGIGCEELKI